MSEPNLTFDEFFKDFKGSDNADSKIRLVAELAWTAGRAAFATELQKEMLRLMELDPKDWTEKARKVNLIDAVRTMS